MSEPSRVWPGPKLVWLRLKKGLPGCIMPCCASAKENKKENATKTIKINTTNAKATEKIFLTILPLF
ncbi:MAG: hypothetical protein K6T73_08015, partial [Candidatus Bathyarchaeota archaeon]|nr:hypothetical protein [Candidatus Bathyarchaeota archaeon]